jgi:hypothetical protein
MVNCVRRLKTSLSKGDGVMPGLRAPNCFAPRRVENFRFCAVRECSFRCSLSSPTSGIIEVAQTRPEAP